jgi:hypothetical protein
MAVVTRAVEPWICGRRASALLAFDGRAVMARSDMTEWVAAPLFAELS